MSLLFNPENIAILLRLLTAHLLTDFVLQPKAWVNERKQLHHKSPSLYKHTLLTTLTAYFFLGQWTQWQIPLIIFITHTITDIWKSYRSDLIRYFIADQLVHVLVITGCWLYFFSEFDFDLTLLQSILSETRFWIYSTTYLFVIYPLGFIIGMMVKKFKVQLRNENTSNATNNETLADAGRWIGIFERLLIVTFVLNNQFGAIGFLIAAKSILRFNNKDEERARKETEYVLIGTLISYTFSIITGLVALEVINTF